MSNIETFNEATYRQCKELADIIIKKQQDYGKNNLLEFGEYGILVRTNDKMSRLKNLRNAAIVNNESIDDTWKDIAGYSVLALLMRNNKFDLPLESNNEQTE